MKNVVFMVDIHEEASSYRSAPYQYSIKSWNNWCKKNDCELFILTQRIYDKNVMNPNWHKLFVFDLLENEGIEYDQILIVDSDTIVHPKCPNFFELSDNKFCAVHNEGSYDWLLRSLENYSKYMFDGKSFPFWRYINSGFLILNKDHRSLYKDIISFYLNNSDAIKQMQETFHVGTDQPIINFFLNINDIDYKILPYEYNMQDMARKEILDDNLTFTKIGWVYHFNAIPENHNAEKTMYWMKRTYEELYEN